MMVKSAKLGEGECTAAPFHSVYLPEQSCDVYASAERADTLPLFFLYPYMYSVGSTPTSLPARIGKPRVKDFETDGEGEPM
jgi:hypothetical protein